ncbi:MAG: hypothetical protein AAGA48_25805 [Myxococcota bacterium]
MAVLLTLWALMSSAFAQPHQVQVYEDDRGFKLLVDDEPVYLFGMNWGYMPVGENYRYDFWSLPDDKIEEALRTEMGLMKRMGINTIRQYANIPPKWVEWIHDNYGIYTMINPLVGRYGVTVDNAYIPQTPYGDPKVRELLINQTMEEVRPYYNTRGVILFMLGNEANYGLEWTSFEIANLPKGDRERAKAVHLYSLYGEIIDKIHAENDHHLVSICNGDLGYLDLIAELAPNQDVFASNVYRGLSSRDLFQRVKDELGIPFFYSEFGSDAYNAKEGREDSVMQAKYLKSLWQELYEQSYGNGASGAALGGYIFQWSDGWWKYNQEINLDIHDTTASWSNRAFIDDFVEDGNNMNEEWFGIAAKTPPRADGLYDVQPRTAYWMLKEAFELHPYEPGLNADRIRLHFAGLEPAAYKQNYDVARIASGANDAKIRISELRVDLGSYVVGGTDKPGRNPANLSYDHLQSIYLGAEAKPDDKLRFETAVNVLGNVPINRIDGIFFENRGDRSGSADDVVEGFNLSGLERVKLYRASFEWRTKHFDMEGFYRTGHYHWAYEGDFFGIYPEANYGPYPDIYNGDVPIGVAVAGKQKLDGLKVVVGPQIYWGANPGVIAKYSRPMGRWRFDIVHQEDIAPLPPRGTVQSQAVPEQLTRKTGIHLGFARGDSFTVDIGGLWAGTPKIGQAFTYVQDAEGNESYLDSGLDVIRDEIRLIDTFGAKAKVTGRIGKLQGYVQGSYQGLVADGGGDYGVTVAGWRLRASGRGNNMSAIGGAALQLGNVVIAPTGLWQRPLIGPNPSIEGQYDPITRVYFPAVRARNFVDDPFAVLDNRETMAGEILIAFDPTPITWFFQWDNEQREDAGFAGSISLLYRHLPTVRDSTFGFLADGTLFSFGGSPPPANLWDVTARAVANVGDVQMHFDAYAGTAQARGTDDRLLMRGGGGMRAYWRSMLFQGWVKFQDWGPYDFHQDFNLTFPFQTYVDISGGLKRKPLVGTTTRIGAFTKFRFLDEFSPAPALVDAQVQPGDPLANEFEVGTYVRLSL